MPAWTNGEKRRIGTMGSWRNLRERTMALLFACAFLFVSWGDAYGVHDCPHHDRLPGTTPAGATAPGATHPESEPSAHGAATDAHGESSRSADHGSHDKRPCTCLGDCQPTSQQVQAVSSTTAPVTFAAASEYAPMRRAWSADVSESPYRLPFANGPPHLI